MTENKKIKTNSWKAWLLATRPKTLAGAAVPVMIGVALALRTTGWQHFRFVPAILCFLFAFLMQVDSNLINDYFDFRHGNDDPVTRLGPKRACSEGWITPRAMVAGLALVSVLACAVGLQLVWYGGWQMIIVGAACVLFAFLYTTFFISRSGRRARVGLFRHRARLLYLLCDNPRRGARHNLASCSHLHRVRPGNRHVVVRQQLP